MTTSPDSSAPETHKSNAYEPMKFTDWPDIDPNLNVHDAPSVVEAKDKYYMEQLIRIQEIKVLREKIDWCYRREGVNQLQNCRHLVLQYLDIVQQGWLKPFKLPERKPTSSTQTGAGDSM